MDKNDSTPRAPQINGEAPKNESTSQKTYRCQPAESTSEPTLASNVGSGVLRAVIADDVHCEACAPEYRKTPVSGVRIGVAGRFRNTFAGGYLALCAYHAGELTAVMLSLRGRF